SLLAACEVIPAAKRVVWRSYGDLLGRNEPWPAGYPQPRRRRGCGGPSSASACRGAARAAGGVLYPGPAGLPPRNRTLLPAYMLAEPFSNPGGEMLSIRNLS